MKNYSILKENLMQDVNFLVSKLENEGDKSYWRLVELNSIIEKYNNLLKSNESELFFLRNLVKERDVEIDRFSVMLSEVDDERNLPLNVTATFRHDSNPDVNIDFYVNIEMYQDLLDSNGELLQVNKDDIERKISHEAENVFRFENINKLNVFEYRLISYSITSHENECLSYGITNKIWDL